MNFELKNNTLSIKEHNKIVLSNIVTYVKYYGTQYNAPLIEPHCKWVLSDDKKKAVNGTFEISIKEGPSKGLFVQSKYTFEEDTNEVAEFCAFGGCTGHIFEKGIEIHSLGIHGIDPCEMQSPVHSVHTVDAYEYNSVDYTVLETDDKRAFVLGTLTWENWFSQIMFLRDGAVYAKTKLDTMPFKKGDVIESELFWFAESSDCITAHEEYAKLTAKMHNVKYIEREAPTGWCSWYYYGDGITKEIISENVNFMKEHKDKLPVKYIQIDGGWFKQWGDWQPNDKFGDMKKMADEIKEAGFIPGIWLAPFGAESPSGIPEEHPDWFVKGKDNKIWPHPFYIFDFSNPEVREYITSVFKRVTEDWGYKYVKLDIVTMCMCPGYYKEKNWSACKNVRVGYETIRKACGDDVFILGCTTPFGPALGSVDGMRVSCDIFERWDSVKSVFNATLKRFHYHRNWFLNDPDCLIVRTKENEDEQCFRPCVRTMRENRTYVTAMAASGGILMLSDKMPLLDDEQIEMLSTLFPANGKAARPLDIMDTCVPGILDFGKRGETGIMAFINWGDSVRTFTVDKDACNVKEFWTKKEYSHNGGTVSITLEPHDSEIVYFTDYSCQNPCNIGQKSILW